MDADEARQQLVLAGRGTQVRPVDRWAVGLGMMTLGLAMVLTVLLQHYRWNMVPFLVVLMLGIVVNATRRTRPRSLMRVMLAATGAALLWAIVETIWFLDDSWDSTSFRWLSGVLFGVPFVLGGLLLLRKPSSSS